MTVREGDLPDAGAGEDETRVPWRWWDAVVVFFLAQVVAAGIGALAVAPLPESYVFPTLAVLSSALLAVLTVLWVRARYPGAMGLLFGRARPTLRQVGAGVALGLAAFVGANVVLSFLIRSVVEWAGGELDPVQQQLQAALRDPTTGPVLAASVILLAPLGEELLFRGLLFRGVRRSSPLWVALFVSALAFSLSHVEPLAVVILFPVGLAFAWALHRRGTLVVPIAAHATFNLINVSLLLFAAA